ncbi:MAG: ATPase [Planctomycetaceae bacterium]|nr:ATPase [Planctomycetaceae bacterium]
MLRKRYAAVTLALATLWPGGTAALLAEDGPPSDYQYGFLNSLRVTSNSLQSDAFESLNVVPVSASATNSLNGPVRPYEDEASETDTEGELSFEDRLARMEKGWEDLDKAWKKLEDAEKKKKADAASKPTYKINGRIHADYWDYLNTSAGIGYFEHPSGAAFGNDPDDMFAFRRIRLEMKGDIPDHMLWRIQVDFNNPSAAELKDGYLGFSNLPGNQVLLIGNQKRPLGLDHLNSSRFNVFMERPLVVETFNSDARRPGICMHGYSDDETYHWSYGAFYLENISGDGRTLGDSRQMSVNGRFGATPWYDDASDGRGYFHWAVAGMAADPDGGASAADPFSNESRFATRAENRSGSRWFDTSAISGAGWYEVLAAEAIMNVGPTQIVGEYQHTFVQRDSGFNDINLSGGYVYVSYFLTGEYIPFDRTSGTIERVVPHENFFLVDRQCGGHGVGWGAWNVAARYSYLDLTDGDVLGGVGNAGTLALNWFWNPFAKVQFNLTHGAVTDHRNVGGYMAGDYTTLGTRFAIEF